MRKPTIIDQFNEMGFSGTLLLLLFLALLAYGAVIHFRKLDQRWRKSFLLASLLQLAVGFFLLCFSVIAFINQPNYSALGSGLPSDVLSLLNEGTLVMGGFTAWMTIILLVFSAFLFITGKKEEMKDSGTPEVERENSSDSQAI